MAGFLGMEGETKIMIREERRSSYGRAVAVKGNMSFTTEQMNVHGYRWCNTGTDS